MKTFVSDPISKLIWRKPFKDSFITYYSKNRQYQFEVNRYVKICELIGEHNIYTPK